MLVLNVKKFSPKTTSGADLANLTVCVRAFRTLIVRFFRSLIVHNNLRLNNKKKY